MSRKDKDSLEDFFRKATSRPDLEFNEDDWSKMEKMLDEHPEKPAAAVSWRKGAVAAISLVAALVVIMLLLWPGSGTEPENIANDTQPAPQTEAAPSEDTESGVGIVRSENNKVADNNDNLISPPRLSTSREAEDRIPGNATEAPSRPGGPDREDVEVNALAPDSPGDNILTGGARTAPSVAIPESPEPGFNRLRPDPQQSLNEGDRDDPPGMVQAGPDQSVDSASAIPIAGALDTAAAAEETHRQKPERPSGSGRFGFSVIAAPDFSMTTRGGAMGPGEAIGIMLHYQVFNRWGITAGIVHNTKKYWGRGSEYNPPGGYWNALTNGVVPDRIDGACAMYEIPVSITFDVIQTRRSRLFASAGLSSYLMRNEDYYYKFDAPNPGAVTGWSGDKQGSLWFGIGTLSAGYDFKATRSLSFGVEPYVKVPLEGVGWADVDLYSTGLMFTARYHFMKNGNKHPPPSLGP